jgi:hypothetical protein
MRSGVNANSKQGYYFLEKSKDLGFKLKAQGSFSGLSGSSGIGNSSSSSSPSSSDMLLAPNSFFYFYCTKIGINKIF